MRENEDNKGFFVTTKTISAALGIMTLIGIGVTTVTTLNSYAFRIEKLETEKVEFASSVKNLTTRIEELNTKLVDLTITLNRLEDRYTTLIERERGGTTSTQR